MAEETATIGCQACGCTPVIVKNIGNRTYKVCARCERAFELGLDAGHILATGNGLRGHIE